MSQDQIQLPEPSALAISYDGQTASSMWWHGDGKLLDKEIKKYGGTASKLRLYSEATVRRLITEAVAAEREACALVCEDRFHEEDCAAAIRARTRAPKSAEQSCIQGLRNVIQEDTQ